MASLIAKAIGKVAQAVVKTPAMPASAKVVGCALGGVALGYLGWRASTGVEHAREAVDWARWDEEVDDILQLLEKEAGEPQTLVVGEVEIPSIRVVKKRTGGSGRRKASKAIAVHLRSKYGMFTDMPANRMVLGREARRFASELGVRKVDIMRVVPMAIEYALTPTSDDLKAASYRKSLLPGVLKRWAASDF